MGILTDSDRFDTATRLREWMDENRDLIAANLTRMGAADLVPMLTGGDQ